MDTAEFSQLDENDVDSTLHSISISQLNFVQV